MLDIAAAWVAQLKPFAVVLSFFMSRIEGSKSFSGYLEEVEVQRQLALEAGTAGSPKPARPFLMFAHNITVRARMPTTW